MNSDSNPTIWNKFMDYFKNPPNLGELMAIVCKQRRYPNTEQLTCYELAKFGKWCYTIYYPTELALNQGMDKCDLKEYETGLVYLNNPRIPYDSVIIL